MRFTPNQVRVDGDVAYVALNRGLEALVDAADLPAIRAFRWTASDRPGMPTPYVAAKSLNAAGRSTTVYLHRLVTGAPKGRTVDHLNHDTLDNRRSNLRVGGQRENTQNRKGANLNSTTGVRGVYVHRVTHKPSTRIPNGWAGTYYNARHMADGKSKTKNFPYTPDGFEAARVWVETQRAG